MHTHWTDYANIESIIKSHNPKHILELGALNGENTRNLLNLQLSQPFLLTVISDDLPSDIESSGSVVYMKGVSYNLIPTLDDNSIDLVLLDTDHNYWTLHQELAVLHPKLTHGALVLIHDVDTFYYNTGIADGYGVDTEYPQSSIESIGNSHGSLGTGLIDFLSANRYNYRLIRWLPEGNGLAIIQKNPKEFTVLFLKAMEGKGKRSC
jgi:hypothetical protein